MAEDNGETAAEFNLIEDSKRCFGFFLKPEYDVKCFNLVKNEDIKKVLY